MNCNEATPLVAAYADGEVDGLRAHSLRKHLAGCATCAAKHQAVLDLRAKLRAEVPYYPAPAALRDRVRSALTATDASAEAQRRSAGDRWRWLATGALGGCAATVLAWVVGTAVVDWRASEDLAAEAVTAHVRATLGTHLTEVASSDQHAVKPWLSARLDFSPPVRDLASEGFTLTGGRRDYLGGQPVAVLVYRYHEHVIDVFVRPQQARAAAPALRSIRGFNVARATGSAMDWVAVSDVSPDVLSGLVERLARDQAADSDARSLMRPQPTERPPGQ
ncbi:MAG TPA: zf-HC2 domain-containing protein [Casimicrobiaceae bacterium]|nr:zf-HC2 domain-containing protein [Casimicrobiaceae bacterium]